MCPHLTDPDKYSYFASCLSNSNFHSSTSNILSQTILDRAESHFFGQIEQFIHRSSAQIIFQKSEKSFLSKQMKQNFKQTISICLDQPSAAAEHYPMRDWAPSILKLNDTTEKTDRLNILYRRLTNIQKIKVFLISFLSIRAIFTPTNKTKTDLETKEKVQCSCLFSFF